MARSNLNFQGAGVTVTDNPAEGRIDVTIPGTSLDASQVKGFVNHGADTTVARPPLYVSVEWFGSVIPDNMIDGDTLILT